MWFNGLDAQAAAKVTVAKTRLELGNTSNIEWFRGIGEYKIDWGPGYRIYLAKEGEALIVLFGGSTKKGQQKAIMRRTMNTRRGRRLSLQPGKGRKHDVDP
jgi:putative addiction module killer protein